jgi:hypothetical protein
MTAYWKIQEQQVKESDWGSGSMYEISTYGAMSCGEAPFVEGEGG